ncbi:MAG: hypothetical protein RIR16_581 [Actinomycetota bacterium]|jgi:Na+-transporting NADH:ubiquinone oxidoreductase subunit NqrC
MTAIRLSAPIKRQAVTAKPSLTLASLPAVANRTSAAVVAVVIAGALVIALLGLVVHMFTSSAVYELAAIQKEKRELTTTAQILSEEVDSLASQQNLANAAQKLGMIANANPVFMRIADQKILGKPTAALNLNDRVSRNLVANAALTAQTTNADIQSALAAAEAEIAAKAVPVAADLPATIEVKPITTNSTAKKATSNVATAASRAVQVVSTGSAIPASPTH